VSGNNVVIQIDRRNVANIVRDRGTVTVTTAGPQGPPGQNGDTIAPISFAFGDATPAVVHTTTVAGTFTTVRVIFDTGFNGTGATIALGTVASPQALLATNQNDPSAIAASEYEVTPDLHVSAGTAIRLSITPGSGASQGAGRILLTFIPD
jgi:hypothetical protein